MPSTLTVVHLENQICCPALLLQQQYVLAKVGEYLESWSLIVPQGGGVSGK